jgi:tetratricopeptide (TPR) repeat protein
MSTAQPNSSQAGRLVRSSLMLLSLFAAACGGGSAEGSLGGTSSGSSSGGQSTKGSTKEVSAKATNLWNEALALFKQYEAKGGWNDGKCDEVAGKFTSASSMQKNFAEALYMAGLAHDRCGRREKALEFYSQAQRANSKFCKARVAIALDRAKHGEASVEREYAAAVADDPQCTEGYVNLAITQRKRGLDGNRDALANLRRALAIDAQYLPAFNEMALLYLSEAADNTKKLDLAEVVCSQAQKINANYAPIYNTWGLIDLRRNKIIEAAAKFQKATQLDSKIFEAYMNFGRITIGFRGYQDAKAAYEQALSLQPSNFEAQLGLGVALRGLQENQAAQEAYEKASKLAPNRPEPYYNLGILYQDFMNGTADEMKKARGYYEQFLSKVGSDKRFAPTVEEINRKCKQEGKRKQGKNACVAGRLQNIQLYLDTMKQMAEMEKLQKEQEKQAAELEAQEKAQQQAAPAAPPAETAPESKEAPK